MELFLAFAVIAAVIIFGALISMGNERQRKAIDELREQAVLWAIQDLRIKREHLAREVRVEDPIGWLNRIATKVCGYDLKLQAVEYVEEARTLTCVSGDNARVFFSPFSPADLRAWKRSQRSNLGKYSTQNPLLSLPRDVQPYQLSALSTGMFFDLELPLAWRALTGQKEEHLTRLWMYV